MLTLYLVVTALFAVTTLCLLIVSVCGRHYNELWFIAIIGIAATLAWPLTLIVLPVVGVLVVLARLALGLYEVVEGMRCRLVAR